MGPKLVGTQYSPVQIDDSYFLCYRKYGKGRLMAEDISYKKRNSSVHEHNENENEVYSSLNEFDWNEEIPEPDENESNPTPSSNHGKRVNGR